MSSSKHPLARTGLVVTELPDEAMIYNFADHQAHCVTALAHQVLLRCDGKTPVAEIGAQLRAAGEGATDAEAWQAVAELAAANLIEVPAPRVVDRGRRRALKQLGLTAGLSVAAPMVWSIVAPSIAEAASTVNCTAMGGCMMNGSEDGEYCGMSGDPAGICTMVGNDSVCIPVGGSVVCS